MSETIPMSYIGSPLLERFELNGLHDYKSIALTCETNVKVVSAENGTGKTTLLNALYALLAGKPRELLTLNFSSFLVKFAETEAITGSKEELFPWLATEEGQRIFENRAGRQLRQYGLNEAQAREMIMLFITGNDADFRSCSGYRTIFEETPLDDDDIRSLCDQVAPEVTSIGNFEEIHLKIKEAMGEVTVLYLPTFRRIEADLPEFRRAGSRVARSLKTREDWDSDRLIFFGLEDVEKRLKSITGGIRKSTLEAYSRISARTLELLIEGAASPDPVTENESYLTSLKLVLARLGKTDTESEARIADLIKTGQINDNQYDSLRSFLEQLSEIYKEKRDEEKAIETFADVVNGYWELSLNEKKFSFDKLKVEIDAINEFTGDPLPLGSLSSGEKQIVSMFARLYLDKGKKYLILIDEPELSLSIDWQRKFLPDVLAAPSCQQLVGITHSPFVFENYLDSYAGSLEIRYSKARKDGAKTNE